MRFPPLLRAACLAAALASVANAQSTEPPIRGFVSRPDPATVWESFPVVAMATGVSGVANILCDVTADGAARCEVEREDPVGYGFGAAALQIMDTVRFNPGVAEKIRLPIRFPTDPSRAPVVEMLAVTGIHGSTQPTPDPAHRRYYPPAAHASDIEGRVIVACAVRANRVVECGVEREEPAGWGFGQAALEIAQIATNDQIRASHGLVFRRPFAFVLREPGADQEPRRMWSREPTPREVRAHYPANALRSGIEGNVSLLCQVLERGALSCEVWNEQPLGWGVGDAARAVGRLYQLSESEIGQPGRSLGDRFHVPVRFSIAG